MFPQNMVKLIINMQRQKKKKKKKCANIGPTDRKQFLKPPVGNMLITKKMVGSQYIPAS